MRIKATKNFAGLISMSIGEEKNVQEKIAASLIKSGYAESVETKKAAAPDPNKAAAPDLHKAAAPDPDKAAAPDPDKAAALDPEKKPEEPKKSK